MSQSPHPLERSLQRLQTALWRRRALTWAIRTAWLTLLVPVLVISGYYWRGWEVSILTLIFSMLGMALVTALWAVRPLRLSKIVRRLDQRLALRTRLTTAFEIGQATPAAMDDNPVIQRLLQETVQIVAVLRSQVRLFSRTFWLEMRTLIAVAGLLSGLIIVNGLRAQVPNNGAVALPVAWQEPTAAEVLSPDIQLQPPPPPQVQQTTLSQAQVQAILDALADALRDQAATRAAADALDRGDVPGAAEALRRLADQLDQLSEQAQGEIGQALQQAAEQIGQNAPQLSEALEAGSQTLQSGDQLGAGEALEAVAEALESLIEEQTQSAENEPNDQPGEPSPEPQAEAEAEAEPDPPEGEAEGDTAGQGDGAGEGDGSGQPSEAERLAAEGEPLELESDSELESSVLQPAELDAEAGDKVTQDSPFAREPASLTGDLGPDPLTYPWDKRDVIRSFFTP